MTPSLALATVLAVAAALLSLSPRAAAPRARSRADVALRNMSEAQELIEQAAQVLSALAGMGSERKRLGCLSSQPTWAWFAVTATANRRRRRSSSAPPDK